MGSTLKGKGLPLKQHIYLKKLISTQGCHLPSTAKFPDFSLTFYSFPYPLTDKKIIFILYFNGVSRITSNLGVTLKEKNLGANSFLKE